MSKTITLQVDDEVERFNYTEWQREYFSKQTLDEFLHKAREYDKQNPFLTGNAE